MSSHDADGESWVERHFVDFLERREREPGLLREDFVAEARARLGTAARERRSWIEVLDRRLASHEHMDSLWPIEETAESPSDFEILDTLGRGGMGSVLRARQRSLGREVALKVPTSLSAASPNELERLRREAEVIARLRHPGIVTLHQLTEEHGTAYLVMELVRGKTLHALLTELAHDPTALASALGDEARDPRSAAIEVTLQVLDALAYAHEHGVVHRDLKPQNIMVDDRGRVRILDFGLCSLEGAAQLTRSSELVGTPQFLPPEVHADPSAFGYWTDVYAVGVLFYQLLTGRYPFGDDSLERCLARIRAGDAPSVRAVDRNIPVELSAIVEKAMAPSLGHRYLSARAMAEDLERYRGGEVVSARPASGLRRWSRKVRRQPIAWVASAVAAATLIVVFSLLIRDSIRAERTRSSARNDAYARLEQCVADERWKDARVCLRDLESDLRDAEERRRHEDTAADVELLAGLAAIEDYSATGRQVRKADAYARFFGRIGFDLEQPARASEWLARHRHHDLLVRALDDWASALAAGSREDGARSFRQVLRDEAAVLADAAIAQDLRRIANDADRNPRRREIRSILIAGRTDELRRIAASDELFRLDLSAMHQLAYGLEAGTELELAARVFRTATLLHPATYDAHFEFAAFTTRNLRTQDYASAAQGFVAAAAFRPRRAVCHANLSVLYGKLGERQLATLAAERCVQLLPDACEPRIQLAISLVEDDPKRSRAVALEGRALAKTDAQRAAIHAICGATLQDADELEAAIALDPDNMLALYALAQIRVRSGDRAAGLALFRAAARAAPMSPQACFSAGALEFERGDFEAAFGWARRLILCGPQLLDDPPVAFLWIARVAARAAEGHPERVSRLEIAAEWLERAVTAIEERVRKSDAADRVGVVAGWIGWLRKMRELRSVRNERTLATLPKPLASRLRLFWLRARSLRETHGGTR